MAPKQPVQPDWNAIVSHYAGRPMTVVFPKQKQNAPGSFVPWGDSLGSVINDQIQMNPRFLENLGNVKSPGLAWQGLSTLLHEAVHTRRPQPGTGFAPWSDERQATALGQQLIPDMLKRFFNIDINSPLSREYQAMTKQYQR